MIIEIQSNGNVDTYVHELYTKWLFSVLQVEILTFEHVPLGSNAELPWLTVVAAAGCIKFESEGP